MIDFAERFRCCLSIFDFERVCQAFRDRGADALERIESRFDIFLTFRIQCDRRRFINFGMLSCSYVMTAHATQSGEKY